MVTKRTSFPAPVPVGCGAGGRFAKVNVAAAIPIARRHEAPRKPGLRRVVRNVCQLRAQAFHQLRQCCKQFRMAEPETLWKNSRRLSYNTANANYPDTL